MTVGLPSSAQGSGLSYALCTALTFFSEVHGASVILYPGLGLGSWMLSTWRRGGGMQGMCCPCVMLRRLAVDT